MAEKRVIEVEVKTNASKVTNDINNAAQATANLGNATSEASKKANSLNDIKNVITGMVPGLKAAEGGVNAFSGSLKRLLANPVILVVTGIVAALKFIYEAFQSNVKIGKEIAAVWSALSGVGSQIMDSVMGLGRALGYAAEAAFKFITLDFEGASKAMKKANEEAAGSYDQLTNAVNGTTFAILRGLEKQQQANNKAKKEQAVRESEINKLLVQSREILTDETESIKNKKKALEAVTKAETESAKEKVRIAAIDLKILQDKAKALGGQAEKKMKQEIREATIALNEAETENAMTGIKLNKQRKMLARQEKEENKAAVDAAKERIKAAKDAREQELKAKKDVIEKIKKAEQEYADSLLTEQEKEKTIVTRKYDELYKEAQKYKLDISKLKENEAAELLKIDKKYSDSREKIINDSNKKANDLRIQAENEFQAQIEAIDEANFQASLQKTMSEDEYALELVRQKYFTLEEAAKGNAEQEKIIAEAKGAELDAINKKYLEKQKHDQQQKVDLILKYAQTFGQAMSSLNGLLNVNDEARLKNVKQGSKEEEAIKRKMFERDKKLRIVQTVIDTASNVVQSVRNGGGIPAGIPFGVAAGVMGAMQIAAISKAKFDGGGGNNTPTPAGGGGGGAAVMSPNFNVVGSSGVNQLAQIQQQPTRAYVVSGDVATGLSLERNRLQNASF
jgi:hypothetical protein